MYLKTSYLIRLYVFRRIQKFLLVMFCFVFLNTNYALGHDVGFCLGPCLVENERLRRLLPGEALVIRHFKCATTTKSIIVSVQCRLSVIKTTSTTKPYCHTCDSDCQKHFPCLLLSDIIMVHILYSILVLIFILEVPVI